ncbi:MULTISPECIES: hypothetical protein [Phyllobacteriaceae]|jgi:hypothetical protein|uniref:hypothetical protein n=1 Tax=Phyllobacteriaceae TaxID=69277 RepID=UPI000463C22E|nr:MULTISPECIES: hypothetical protein [Mesorhizobium]MBN9237862.1 hypothetical protein [Mesorhizobium sp.]MDQ0328280.1 hypothetical protein [Mesorhizobium sp. YL-MeA3-2017]
MHADEFSIASLPERGANAMSSPETDRSLAGNACHHVLNSSKVSIVRVGDVEEMHCHAGC